MNDENGMIAIVDYGMGNLRSVAKAIERMGGQAVIVDTADGILAAPKIILPGVGAFGDAQQENYFAIIDRCAGVEYTDDLEVITRRFEVGGCYEGIVGKTHFDWPSFFSSYSYRSLRVWNN